MAGYWTKPGQMDEGLWKLMTEKISAHVATRHPTYTVLGGYCHRGDDYASLRGETIFVWEVTTVVEIPGDVAPYEDLYSVFLSREGQLWITG